MKPTHITSLLTIAALSANAGPPPPGGGGTNSPCTNCPPQYSSPPTHVERYGYHILMQWTDHSENPVVGMFWESNSYASACHMVPTSHVAIVSNGVPLQVDNTNRFSHEISIYGNGSNILAIFWAPNAYSYSFGESTNLLSWTQFTAEQAPINFFKDPTQADPWWPYVYWRPQPQTFGPSRSFFRLRREDYGLGWTNICQ